MRARSLALSFSLAFGGRKLTLRFQPPASLLPPSTSASTARAPICLPCSEPVFARRAQHPLVVVPEVQNRPTDRPTNPDPPSSRRAGTNASVRVRGDTLMTGGTRARPSNRERGDEGPRAAKPLLTTVLHGEGGGRGKGPGLCEISN